MLYWLFDIQDRLDASHNDSSISDCSYSKHETLCPRVWHRPLHCLHSNPFKCDCSRPERIPSPKKYSVFGMETAFQSLLEFFFEKHLHNLHSQIKKEKTEFIADVSQRIKF